jgi:hypothetical protein
MLFRAVYPLLLSRMQSLAPDLRGEHGPSVSYNGRCSEHSGNAHLGN